MKVNIPCVVIVSGPFGVAKIKDHMAADVEDCRRVIKKVLEGAGVVLCGLGMYVGQAQGAQSEADAVAALCDAIRYQAYSTMELRQFSTPKHKLKEMVDRNITNVNSRLNQYKIIDEAYMVDIVSSQRAGLIAHDFAENQHEKCMKAQRDIAS